jgi:hypothetical protein
VIRRTKRGVKGWTKRDVKGWTGTRTLSGALRSEGLWSKSF